MSRSPETGAGPRQLALDVQLRPHNDFNNFYVTPANRELLAAAAHWAQAESRHLVYLRGVEQSGRTHMLEAVCRYADTQAMVYLPMAELVHSGDAGLFDGLESMRLICLDDVDVLAGKADWEQGLFHLFNRVLQQPDTSLLVTGLDKPPAQLFELADLASRLSSMLGYRLQAMDDGDKAACLQQRAGQIGLEIDAALGDYILLRADRQLASLIAILDTLDKASLAAQRRLTKPFVKQTMGW